MTEHSHTDQAEVSCPKCGHRFALDEQVIDHYRHDWERALRKRVRGELRAENQKEVERQAQRLAAKEVREKDEEVRERDRQIASLRRQVTTLSRKLPAPRAQSLGDVRQETLAQNLAVRCPQDEFTEVAHGVRGADVVHSICDSTGQVRGSIFWESKRAANWNNRWPAKLREDVRRGNHAVGVIVSDVLPDPDRAIINLDGVWVTTLEVAPDLAVLLRDGILQIANARGSRARRDDLKGLAYDYLAGPEFASHVEAIIENARKMRLTLDKERRSLTAGWAEREQQINTVVLELAGVYGDLRGLGAALPVIEMLELPSQASDGAGAALKS